MAESFEAVYERIKAQVGQTRLIRIGKIERREMERFAVAADDANPLFFDDAFARDHGYAGAIAPPLYLSSVLGWESGPAQDSLCTDGTPSNDAMAVPIGGLRLMGGGQELEFHQAAIAGMDVVMEFSVSNVELKQGRSGSLLLVQLQKRFLSAGGDPILICRENFIAR